jgi:Outer membrane protein beta-barrel domain
MKRILISVALVAGSAVPLLAQDSTSAQMTTTRRITDTTVTQRTVKDTAYGAQPTVTETANGETETVVQYPGVGLMPYVGYMMFGDNFRPGAGVRFASDNAVITGAELGLNLGKSFSIVGNVGYTKPTWNIGSATVPTTSVNASMWLFDGALRLRFPIGEDGNVGARFVPFLQVGAGAIRYSLDDNPFDADGTTNLAFNAGAGADFRLSRSFGLRLMAKDYITSLNWSSASNVDLNDRRSNNVALNFGLVLGF